MGACLQYSKSLISWAKTLIILEQRPASAGSFLIQTVVLNEITGMNCGSPRLPFGESVAQDTNRESLSPVSLFLSEPRLRIDLFLDFSGLKGSINVAMYRPQDTLLTLNGTVNATSNTAR